MEENTGLFGLEVLGLKKQGIIWTFKHGEGKLLLKISAKAGDLEALEWQEVGADFCGYFSFVITLDHKIHCIYKNAYEQVVYKAITPEGKKESFKIEFAQNEQITYEKVISLGGGKLLIVVFTENPPENKWKIYSCLKENGVWLEPEIVDSGWGFGIGQGAIAVGNEGQVYLVYQKFNQGYQLLYRVNKNNLWSECVLINSSQEFNFHPSITIDTEGVPHLVWLRSTRAETRVMYTGKSKLNSFWTRWQWNKEELISSPGTDCSAPFVMCQDNCLKIYWQVPKDTYSSIFCLKKRDNEEAKLIEKIPTQGLCQVVLNLDKYPQIIDYSGLDKGSTLLFLLAQAQPKQEKETKEGDSMQLSKDKHYIPDELLQEQAKVEKLEMINARLQNTLVRKNEDYSKARSKWEIREQELIKEIERLKQSQEAVKKTNEELRRRLKEQDSLVEEQQKKEQDTTKLQVRVYPHFPFGKKNS